MYVLQLVDLFVVHSVCEISGALHPEHSHVVIRCASLTLRFCYVNILQPKTGCPLKLSRVELVSTWMGDLG